MASADNLFVVVTFFGLAIFFLVVMVFWNSVVSEAPELFTGSSIGPTIQNNGQNLYNTFDFILVFAYFALHLGVIILAFLLRTHPVVYIASIILIAVLTLVAAPLSNAYEDFTQENEISAAAADIPITNYVLSQLPLFEVIWGLLTAVIMFGLARFSGFI